MKFETNFVTATVNWVKLLGNLLLSMFVLLMLTFAYLYYQDISQKQNTENLNNQQKKLDQHIQEQQIQIRQYLAENQLQVLKRDINTINSVSGSNSLNISSVFNVIELALPENVYLEKISYDSSTAETALTAQSTESDLLNEFIDKLQQDPRFTKIELVDQKQIRNRQSVVFRYQMKLQHKYQ